MALQPMSARRGQKVCSALPLYSWRTKVGRGGGGGWADEGVLLEARQSCGALEVDAQTSFLCVKPLSYTQRYLPEVSQRFFRAREDSYGLFLRHTGTCQPWDAVQLSLFQALWLAAG